MLIYWAVCSQRQLRDSFSFGVLLKSSYYSTERESVECSIYPHPYKRTALSITSKLSHTPEGLTRLFVSEEHSESLGLHQ